MTLSGREGDLGCRHATLLGRQEADARLSGLYRSAARQTLDRLAASPDRPAAMAAFDSLFGEDWRHRELGSGDRPVVGYLCNFVPDELVLALGAVPVRLDLGFGAAAEAAARVLPVDVCPEVKALVGAHLGDLPPWNKVDLLVVPTACDGKKKLVRLLGEQREVWMMELPQTRDTARARQQWLEEIRALAARLERLAGRRLRRRALKQAIDLVNRRSALARRLAELRWEDPRRLSGPDTFLVMQASFFADPAWWIEQTEALVRELEGRRSAGASPPRILLTGSPVLFPDFQLLRLIEEGGVVVADEMCSGTQRLYNPTVVDEATVGGMLRAVAEKTLMPCTCPCFVGEDLRVDRVLDLARRSGARGVIHHTLRLCQLFDIDVPRLAEALRARGLPLLSVYTEHGGEAEAVLKNRVDAFLEMLQQ